MTNPCDKTVRMRVIYFLQDVLTCNIVRQVEDSMHQNRPDDPEKAYSTCCNGKSVALFDPEFNSYQTG